MDARTQREIYLPPFEAAVTGPGDGVTPGAMSVMCAYNLVGRGMTTSPSPPPPGVVLPHPLQHLLVPARSGVSAAYAQVRLSLFLRFSM